MDAKRKWLRAFIILGLLLTPVMAYLEDGMRAAVVSAVTILLVVLCAAVAVFVSRAPESDSDPPTPAEPWET
jgi:predicted membrane channel-forming protein YqfA (hemolysin III family)